MRSTLRHATGALAVLAALCFASAPSAADQLHDLRSAKPIHGNAAAGKDKANICMACHGSDGHAVVPQFPNLGGQSPTYLYLQMQAYKEGRREHATMQAQLAPMSDADLRNLSAFFASMPRYRAGGADGSSRGATLYHDGDPALGIPGCQGCHGNDGSGPNPDNASAMPRAAWASFPALAGQPVEYVVAQLHAYRDGTRHGNTNAAVMHGVTGNLDDTDIQAIADYIAGM